MQGLLVAIHTQSEYQKTYVERGATLGANCTIVCGRRIGMYSFVAAGAVVTSDVKPFALIMGVPGRQVGWWSAWGMRIPLPLEGSGSWACPHTGDAYALIGSNLIRTNSHASFQ